MDFPDPDTPVIPIKQPNGTDNVIFFKLFPEASFKIKCFPEPNLLWGGVRIDFFPAKNCPVIDLLLFIMVLCIQNQ